jgi:hypothetical protein
MFIKEKVLDDLVNCVFTKIPFGLIKLTAEYAIGLYWLVSTTVPLMLANCALV